MQSNFREEMGQIVKKWTLPRKFDERIVSSLCSNCAPHHDRQHPSLDHRSDIHAVKEKTENITTRSVEKTNSPPRLRQEIVVDLFSAPLEMVEHMQQLPSRNRTSPSALHLHDQISLPPVSAPRLDALGVNTISPLACQQIQCHVSW